MGNNRISMIEKIQVGRTYKVNSFHKFAKPITVTKYDPDRGLVWCHTGLTRHGIPSQGQIISDRWVFRNAVCEVDGG
jgi:hypothetical protein